jgi:hypothetical protein
MSGPVKQTGPTEPRAEIVIEPHFHYGARVFLNQGGGITVEQRTDYSGEAQLVFDLDEAVAVAEALLEVVRAAGPAGKEAPSATA